MFGKKTLRLATAALMVGVAMGAQHALPRQAHAAGETGVIAITDWQAPDGCGAGSSSVADVEICAPLSDGLFTIDQNLNYIPDLNVDTPSPKNGDVKTVNGNLVVTFKLKPNQKWDDGTPLTANDLVFGTKLLIAIGNSTGFDQITNFKVIDPRTLQCTYNGQFAPFVPYAPVPEPQAYLQKKYGSTDMATIATKFVTDLYNSPSDVTNGPYKISSWATGNVVLVPNPYYNAMPPAKGHPRLAQLKFVTVSGDESGLAAALGSPNVGIDKAEDFQANDLPVLQASKFHITVQPALFVEHLELNEAGPLKDVRLRQALQYAIDKKSLFHQLFPQIKDPNTFLLKTALPNTSPWADKSAKVSQYSPAKAKALLKAAGYATDYNGPGKHLLLRFDTTNAAIREKDFQILSRYWAAVGIHVSANFASGSPAANGGLFSPYNLNGILLQRRYDIALFAFSEPPDPQSTEDQFNPSHIPTAAEHAGADQNYNGITDKDQFNLLVKARSAIDVNQRKSLFNQWQKLENQRVYWIMLYARTNITADDGKIGNYLPNPSSAGNSWNAYQWYAKAS